MNFRTFGYWRRSHRAASKLLRVALRREILAAIASRAGPPAIALARQRYADRDGIVIDPLETEARVHPAGVEVRAWLLVPQADVPPQLAETLLSTTAKLAPLPPVVRQIFFLGTSYGIRHRDIAVLLDMSGRTVRRAMLRAIAALDTETHEDAGVQPFRVPDL